MEFLLLIEVLNAQQGSFPFPKDRMVHNAYNANRVPEHGI
jgi:hypothetical protein